MNIENNIHSHCQQCINIFKCNENSRKGMCCDVISCPNGCCFRFHECKLEEHLLLCSNTKISCLNVQHGCPVVLQRCHMSEHLSSCPASIVVCTAEWNRWSLGVRERERLLVGHEMTSLYSASDLDMALALHDQMLINEMHSVPIAYRKSLCNKVNRRFPPLPIFMFRSAEENKNYKKLCHLTANSSLDDDETELTPGLSKSVSAELLRGRSLSSRNCQNTNVKINNTLLKNCNENEVTNYVYKDDITAFTCTHGLLRSLCMFCRDDPEEPEYKFGNVWREERSFNYPGELSWKHIPRVEKVKRRDAFGRICYKKVDESDEEEDKFRTENIIINEKGIPVGLKKFSTPPPAELVPKSLTVELTLKHYSRHQTKPRTMYTFQCLEVVRRDEYLSHYKNIHSEIHEGLDGWLLQRCPFHIYGCPFSVERLHPDNEESKVIYSEILQTFGVKSLESVESHSPAVNNVFHHKISLTDLPFELLQCIANYLDSFSLNNLSLTSRLLRDVAGSLLPTKGVVIWKWKRLYDSERSFWVKDKKVWRFTKAVYPVKHWVLHNAAPLGEHLLHCPFNKRNIQTEPFSYSQNLMYVLMAKLGTKS